MGRGLLMALLALDLLVMGTSGYVLWDRVHKNLWASPLPPALPVSAQVAPPISRPNEPRASAKAPEEKPPEEETAQTEAGPPRKISFSYRDPGGQRVSIAGDFNHWSPQLMKKDASGRWSSALNLKPGAYAYNFMVDGKMIRDPSRQESKKRQGQKIPASVLTIK